MANKGVAPADLTSDVGRLRAILGDMDYVPLDPPEAGFGDYGMYSDGELSVFLGQGESVEGGAYFAYMQMAAAAAMESRSVKDFDLSIDLTRRSGDLRAIAQMWWERAEALTADIFEVFNISGGRCGCELAEGVSCGGRCGGLI